ncbi:hypothetical protein C0993_011130 [Termitomyces sp. T159_Od127]|nr:hypothetical protein C0993_011130 [Termitomyces sp. T159_Od127]
MHEWRNTPNPMVKRTYHWAVLVRRAWVIVERAREAEARGEAVTLSKKSLVLPMRQNGEERESSKGKHKASPPLLPMEKGKKRARVVSPAAVTPKVELEEEEDKVRCLAVAIKASKAPLVEDDLVGPSCQAEAPQDVGNWQEDEEQQEEAEVGPEAIPQVHPWGEKLLQWSWLLEWGASNPATWDVSSDDEPELWELRCRVTARAAQMERILAREREAVRAELMGLHLQYLMLQWSMEMLCNYQEDMTQALEWQEENNIQEGDLLPLRNPSLPSNDD